jgi:hypothetical protein
MQIYPKERIKLHFNFGRHATAEDADLAKTAIRAFRPHFFVYEGADTTAEDRVEDIKKYNEVIEFSRKRGSKYMLPILAKEARAKEYGGELLRGIIASYKLRIYFLEGVPAEKMKELELAFETNTEERAEKLITGRVEDAGADIGQNLGVRARSNLEREATIIDNLVKFPEEVVSLFPEVRNAPELRVLIRYGTMHRAIFDEAVRCGFHAEISVDDSGELPLKADVLALMHKDTSKRAGILTREETVLLAFGEMLNIIGMDNMRLARAMWESLGVEGAMELLRANRVESKDEIEKWKGGMQDFIRNWSPS